MRYVDAMKMATRRTSKYSNYLPLYDLVLATLRDDPVLLEIGVANGGSMETWRRLLGAGATIIGIDLNPAATRLAEEGFTIHTLDTGCQDAWDELSRRYPEGVDLLVDDGGHTNAQQIAAVTRGVDLVRDGGWIVLEDVHASFMRYFGNPGPFSTAAFLSRVADDLHRRSPRSDRSPRWKWTEAVEYIVVANSWVGLRIRRETSAPHEVACGDDASLMDYDHRWDSTRLNPSRLGHLRRFGRPASFVIRWITEQLRGFNASRR